MQTENRSSASITFNPRLRELLDSGRFDWDDIRQRIAYLKAWVNMPRNQEEKSLDR